MKYLLILLLLNFVQIVACLLQLEMCCEQCITIVKVRKKQTSFWFKTIHSSRSFTKQCSKISYSMKPASKHFEVAQKAIILTDHYECPNDVGFVLKQMTEVKYTVSYYLYILICHGSLAQNVYYYYYLLQYMGSVWWAVCWTGMCYGQANQKSQSNQQCSQIKWANKDHN